MSVRGGARPGAGAPKKHVAGAAERMRRARERERFLYGYRDKDGNLQEGLVHIRGICVKSLKAIAADPSHPHCVAAIRIYAERFAPAKLELEGDVVGTDVRKALESIAESMKQDPDAGRVKAVDVPTEGPGISTTAH